MAISNSPVQLVDYFVLEQWYVRHAFEREDGLNSVENVQVNVGGTRDPHGLALVIDVYVNTPDDEKDKRSFVHEARIRLGGRFFWYGEHEPENKDRLMIVNGVSILYGIARAQLAQASSLSIGQRLILPSMSFVEVEATIKDEVIDSGTGEGEEPKLLS